MWDKFIYMPQNESYPRGLWVALHSKQRKIGTG